MMQIFSKTLPEWLERQLSSQRCRPQIPMTWVWSLGPTHGKGKATPTNCALTSTCVDAHTHTSTRVYVRTHACINKLKNIVRGPRKIKAKKHRANWLFTLGSQGRRKVTLGTTDSAFAALTGSTEKPSTRRALEGDNCLSNSCKGLDNICWNKWNVPWLLWSKFLGLSWTWFWLKTSMVFNTP